MLAATALLAGCGASASAHTSQAATIHLVDDAGHHLTLKKPATRIVVIEPSNGEIVLDLGLKSDIVGADQSIFQYTPSPWKSELTGLKDIGSAYPGINVESLVARKPDLVITGPGIKGIPSLAQYHIPVLTLNPANIQGIYHDILLVGQATGRTRQAKTQVATMKQEIKAVELKVKTVRSRPTVFYDMGGLYTAGPHSFVNSLIDLAGAVNVGASLSRTAYPQVTAEQVVAANPQDILIDSSAGTSVTQEEHLAGFSAIRAVKSGHVYVVPNSSYIDQPSPALVTGLKELVNVLHPGLLKGQ
ncbi:ABC transporter substrate-binding protein [Sulfobacillus sp. DSM 109850]|uniref:ABC transporter substrate-binding protein n=2 Tax=Sulfobacillus harzensis TaxID=2729629 RepID=A0A7Y0L3R1_9FIRM|nr:ABC transporter substrate-binding protein [Sulfobacillus harzensis]